ncbi:histidine phosphatase family protein [Oceanobacillus bengalensis]|uniref:Histidine phosphatase family protein n=1 Tax=Oceanobacillus bengalensis TaxID=1435466 RepID=A0A494YY92_9BACI|nr:histidine phosphatase family protein [Oceanobacillus bengalensis]RKQ15200.1 histidine phosphatase family protein [Oceanobacillus bengalensis]
MTKICFVRHGETEWNALGKIQGKTDIPLNQMGIKQAEQCAAYLNPSDFDLLISSPLKRARQTADIINNKLNLPIVEMADFAERSFGVAEGMTLKERQEKYQNRNFPNEEKIEPFTDRVLSGIQNINAAYPNQSVLLVAHGAVIMTILHNLSNGEIAYGKTALMNACISNIQYTKDRWSIKNFNLVDHLYD